MATNPRLEGRLYYDIALEPVRGCKGKCSWCTMGDLPHERHFMTSEVLETSLRDHKHLLARLPRGQKIEVFMSEGGNPPENPRLAELTQIVRKHAPPAHIVSFWSLWGATEQELAHRTKGLDELVASVDRPHWQAIKAELAELGRPHSNEVVTQEMAARLKIAKRVAEQNKLKLTVRLVAKEGPEAASFTALVRNALESGYHLEPRNPVKRGFSLGRLRSSTLYIWHDGQVTDYIPRSLMLPRPKT